MFSLDFDICQVDCDTLMFTDNTGRYIPNYATCCKTGYDYTGNPLIGDVVSTSFDFTYPDGTTMYTSDLGYIPPVPACATFEVTAAEATGSIAVISGGSIIGSSILLIDITQMLTDLVNDINSGADTHNLVASLTGAVVTICSTIGGTDPNDTIITICPFDITVDSESIVLAGGAGSDDLCFEFGSGDIDGTLANSCFSDGVYTVTYTVEVDEGGQETVLYTETKKFLFDCQSKSCLKNLILLAAKPGCSCSTKELHDKVQQLRTDIESANVLFCECEYDCANELIQRSQNFCQNVCLDCE